MKQLKLPFENNGGTLVLSDGSKVHFLDPNKPANKQVYQEGIRYTNEGEAYDKKGHIPDSWLIR